MRWQFTDNTMDGFETRSVWCKIMIFTTGLKFNMTMVHIPTAT